MAKKKSKKKVKTKNKKESEKITFKDIFLLFLFYVIFRLVKSILYCIKSIFKSNSVNERIQGIIAFFVLLSLMFLVINVIKLFFRKFTISYGSRYNMKDLDMMEGYRFEYAVADILKGNGYKNVDVTPSSGDYGVDILATDRNGNKIAVQCKRFTGNVGVKAVQEVFSGATYYNCNIAMVITNSHFTKQAVQFAKKTGVELIDRERLNSMLNKITVNKKIKIPKDINSEEYIDSVSAMNDEYTYNTFGRSWIADQGIKYVISFYCQNENGFKLLDFNEDDNTVIANFGPVDNYISGQTQKLQDEIYNYLHKPVEVKLYEDHITLYLTKKRG